MNLAAIVDAVAVRVGTVARNVYPFPPDTLGEMTVVTAASGQFVDFHESFAKGLAMVRVTVTPYLPYINPRSTWQKLFDLCSGGTGETTSIVDALMDTDRTLGGVCSDLVVDDVTNIQMATATDGARYLAADLNIRIYIGRT